MVVRYWVRTSECPASSCAIRCCTLAAMMACVLGLPSARSVATGEGRLLLLLWLLLLNSIFLFLFCRDRLFLFFTAATADKNRR